MTTMIWDGNEFLHVDKKEADRLVKEDKAQIMDGTVDGLSMKYRREFTGYNKPVPQATADADILAAAAEPAPEVEAPSLPTAAKSEEPDPMSKAVQKKSMKDWRTYKKMVADDLGQPFNKTTKADVEAWLEKQG